MSDEGSLRHQASRGERAKRIIEDDLVVETLDALEREVYATWRNSAIDEEDVRRDAYFMLKAIEQFKQRFRVLMSDGQKARHELNHKEAKR